MFETKNPFQGSSKKKGKQKLDVSKLEKKSEKQLQQSHYHHHGPLTTKNNDNNNNE